MAMNFNQELINYLREFKICRICQLRYLKARGTEYVDIKETFENLNVTYDDEEDSGIEEPESKKLKLETDSACPQCLGLFSEKIQNEIVEAITNANIGKYEYNGIVIAITTPVALYIRQLAMWYALIRKFPDKITINRSPDVPIKEAAKLILNPIICKKLNKKYDINGISINLYLKHNVEDDTLEKFKQLHDYRTINNYKQKRVQISRTLIENQYSPSSVDLDVFEQYFEIPSPLTEETLFLDKVELLGPTIYVAGRYRKYSRNLSHTPWVLNGKRIKDDSIQEILIRNIAPHFYEGNGKIIFMSSGREDVDVRCLGRGRPFLLEIPNSLRSNLTQEQAYAMEREIEKSKKVSARHLQIVPKEEQTFIKTGEEHKKKHYRALCRLTEPVTLEMLEKLNSTKEFVIQQKTPLRVLHRRPLLTRPRTIYGIKAYVDENRKDVLILDVATQAGTYIKELVHGEFGRTQPSIASILNKKIDIIALDVTDIELDWPKNIDNSLAKGQQTINETKSENENILESKECLKESNDINIDDDKPSTSKKALQNLQSFQKAEAADCNSPSTTKEVLKHESNLENSEDVINKETCTSNQKLLNEESLLSSEVDNEKKVSSKAEDLTNAGPPEAITTKTTNKESIEGPQATTTSNGTTSSKGSLEDLTNAAPQKAPTSNGTITSKGSIEDLMNAVPPATTNSNDKTSNSEDLMNAVPPATTTSNRTTRNKRPLEDLISGDPQNATTSNKKKANRGSLEDLIIGDPQKATTTNGTTTNKTPLEDLISTGSQTATASNAGHQEATTLSTKSIASNHTSLEATKASSSSERRLCSPETVSKNQNSSHLKRKANDEVDDLIRLQAEPASSQTSKQRKTISMTLKDVIQEKSPVVEVTTDKNAILSKILETKKEFDSSETIQIATSLRENKESNGFKP